LSQLTEKTHIKINEKNENINNGKDLIIKHKDLFNNELKQIKEK
jgi:hypothetical protein